MTFGRIRQLTQTEIKKKEEVLNYKSLAKNKFCIDNIKVNSFVFAVTEEVVDYEVD